MVLEMWIKWYRINSHGRDEKTCKYYLHNTYLITGQSYSISVRNEKY